MLPDLFEVILPEEPVITLCPVKKPIKKPEAFEIKASGDGGGYEIHNFMPKNWWYSNEKRRTDQLSYRSNCRSLRRVA